MVLSNVIVDITIFRRPFVFSQSYVQISASLTDVRGLGVPAFDLVYCSLSADRFVLVFNIRRNRFVSDTDVGTARPLTSVRLAEI